MDRCDIIIPVWNQLKVTRDCVESIRRATDYPYRLIIIDNGSDDGTGDYLDMFCARKEADIMLVRNSDNLGFVKAANQGLRLSDAPYACLMNNDTVAASGWLTEMMDVMESDPAIGMVNPSSNTSGQSASAGQSLDDYAATLRQLKGQTQELYNCRGFCMLLRRSVIAKVGLLDEIYGMGYFEETDYCKRAYQHGFRAVRAKAAYVYHKERATFDKLKNAADLFKTNEDTFFKRWGRPVRVAYIVDSMKYPDRIDAIATDAARLGHRISIFLKKGLPWPVKLDHFDIRRIDMSPFLFGPVSIYKIFKDRKKKGHEVIVTDNRPLGGLLTVMKPLHGSDVVVGADKERVLELLEERSRYF